MPVKVDAELRVLSQSEFAALAYEVMGIAFKLHKELGRLFDEKVYRNALAKQIGDMRSEVKIDVMFQDFCKSYYMDVLIAGGGPFELKAAECLTDGHRGQMLNYLLLSGLMHGKVVNFRPDRVEHEFVNTSLTYTERTSFNVDEKGWDPTAGFGCAEKDLVVELLRGLGYRIEQNTL